MEKYELQTRVLMCLMDEGLAFQNVLQIIDKSTDYLHKVLCKLTNEGMIDKRSVTVTVKKRKYNYSYRAITRKGVQWLIDNRVHKYEWLSYLPNPFPSFSITKGMSNDNVQRALKCQSASILFELLGIESIGTAKYTDDVNDNSFRSITGAAKADYLKNIIDEQYKIINGRITDFRYKKCNGIITDDNNGYKHGIFISSKQLGDYFGLASKEVQQRQFSSHIGLLVNRLKSYLIYYATPQGLEFQKSTVDRVRVSAVNYLSINGLTDEGYGAVSSAIVLCKNAREFERLYTSNQQEGETVLSELFKSIYVIPVSRYGVCELADILTYNDSIHDKIIDCIINNQPNFSKNSGHVAELLYYRRIKTFIGTDMDIVRIQHFHNEVTAEEHKHIQYLILCFEWQIDYYSRIFPDNVRYYIADVDFMNK